MNSTAPNSECKIGTLSMIFVVFAIIGSVYSLATVGPILQCGRYITRGQRLFSDNEFAAAESSFRAALKVSSKAESAKVGLAASLFRQETDAKNAEAMRIVQTTYLSKDDKVELLNAAPKRYRSAIQNSYGSSDRDSEQSSSETESDETSANRSSSGSNTSEYQVRVDK